MSKSNIVWKKHENLRSQVDNFIISPFGQVLKISYMSHDYYLDKLVKEEFKVTDSSLRELKRQARAVSGNFFIREENLIIAKFGYISIHTSGTGLGWIQGPLKLTQDQKDSIQLEYSLGNISPFLYEILTNYEEVAAEYLQINEGAEAAWWEPFQINIDEVDKRKPSQYTETELENGYILSVY